MTGLERFAAGAMRKIEQLQARRRAIDTELHTVVATLRRIERDLNVAISRADGSTDVRAPAGVARAAVAAYRERTDSSQSDEQARLAPLDARD